ncbi:MAG: hypothetical protein U0L68_05975 [Prevotellamassilia sp.]|nr:hypothetical protein [Prevotellamassilia sp.]
MAFAPFHKWRFWWSIHFPAFIPAWWRVPGVVAPTSIIRKGTPAALHIFKKEWRRWKKLFHGLKIFCQGMKKVFQGMKKNFQAWTIFLKIFEALLSRIGYPRGVA